MNFDVPKKTRPPKPRTAPEPDAVIGARWIPLTRGAFALVDEGDFESLSAFLWRLTHQGYASRDVSGSAMSMHRQIMMHAFTDDKSEVDHVDGNKLDNRRSNLRVATHQENMRNRKRHSNNSSGHKGVIWRYNKWQAQTVINRKLVIIGRYASVKEAASAYQEYTSREFGEFFRIGQ